MRAIGGGVWEASGGGASIYRGPPCGVAHAPGVYAAVAPSIICVCQRAHESRKGRSDRLGKLGMIAARSGRRCLPVACCGCFEVVNELWERAGGQWSDRSWGLPGGPQSWLPVAVPTPCMGPHGDHGGG